jgi:hypothetical protein
MVATNGLKTEKEIRCDSFRTAVKRKTGRFVRNLLEVDGEERALVDRVDSKYLQTNETMDYCNSLQCTANPILLNEAHGKMCVVLGTATSPVRKVTEVADDI